MAMTLGDFEVDSLIATGGMGAVYRGEHPDGYPAAVKLLRPSTMVASAEFFLREVRAAATLNHTSIVALYDYGEVTEAESRASDGEFRSGDLWFAMEYATLGSIEGLDVRSWAVLRRGLTEMLDALAHAHARGVIHRDLKPGNVLLTERDGAVRLLLADFGIAHMVDPDQDLPERTEEIEQPNAGTPRYMAPEQIRANWRELGPWTDLYALGCMAWELATGKPLFDFPTVVGTAMAHMTQLPGDFEPMFDVPAGFEGWLRDLLKKSSQSRPQRAADAAWALIRMDQTFGQAEGTTDLAVVDAIRAQFQDVHLREVAVPTLGTLVGVATDRLPSIELRALNAVDSTVAQTFLSRQRPPFPRDWRPAASFDERPRSGLALFGLRDVPMVGRQDSRDYVWSLLGQAETREGAATLVIEAPEGRGKSTLLRWLAQRAHELGVATILRVGHSAMAGPTTGLSAMVARHLRCAGLGRRQAFERIVGLLEGRVPPNHLETEAAALTQVVVRADALPSDAVPKVKFDSPRERYTSIERLFRLEAERRPLLLLVDDAQWGADALGFVTHLTRSLTANPFPLLTVVALDREVSTSSALVSRRIEALAAEPRTQTYRLRAMSAPEHAELLNGLIHLRGEVADKLLRKAEDDTNYSICVLSDWVERTVLLPTEDGYGLRNDADTALPADVVEAWDARIDHFSAHFAIPDRVRECLEVAAALGTEVDREEWRAVCERRQGEWNPAVIRRLVDDGVARLTSEGFVFSHSALIEALRRRSVAYGRWEAIHADCGAVIRRDDQNGASGAERRGVHYLRAGEVTAALAELEIAITRRLARSFHEEALELCRFYLDACEKEDPTALLVRAQQAQAMRFMGDIEGAENAVRELLAASDREGSIRGRAEALRVLAGLEHARGNASAGVQRYTEALSAFERIDDRSGVSRCAHGRGWLLLHIGKNSAAAADFARGAEVAAAIDEPLDVAWSQQGLAEAALAQGRLEAARQAASTALDGFRESGSRSGEGMALTSLANVCRESGDVDGARVLYRSAVDLLSSFESHLVTFPQLHFGYFELLYSTPEAAQGAFESVIVSRAPLPFRVVAATALAGLAARGDEGELAAALEVLQGLLVDPDRAAHQLLPVVFARVATSMPKARALQLEAMISALL